MREPNYIYGPYYTALASEHQPIGTAIFTPGMACNRFGHPYSSEPQGLVSDLVGKLRANHNIFFVDTNDFGKESPKSHIGRTIEVQANCLTQVYDHLHHRTPDMNKLLFIGQSLGSLAIALFASTKNLPEEAYALFIAPPANEGYACRHSLSSMFTNTKTELDSNYNGALSFGDNQLMSVNEEYWESIERNSLRYHSNSLRAKFVKAIGLYATSDKYFHDSEEYLTKYTSIDPVAIEGSSHTFKTQAMREQSLVALATLYPYFH